MINPVNFYVGRGHRVTSPFGWRTHPITGNRTHHNGVDFAMKRGEPLLTPYGGVVKTRGSFGARGRTLAILIAPGILQITQHLDSYNCHVGDVVKAGDIIGAAGASGTLADGSPSVTGPHLHYELRIDNGTSLGSPVWGDPKDFYLQLVKSDGYHTVISGDSLGRIATRYNVTVTDLIEWNAEKYPSLKTNPGLIYPGWILAVAPPKPVIIGEHIVVSGDRFWRIAQSHNVTVDELAAVNPHIKDPGQIKPGDVIYIPASQPEEPRDDDALRRELEHCREQYAQVSSALKIANSTIDKKRLYIADLEARLTKIHATSNFK